jgi:hypothetical protein
VAEDLSEGAAEQVLTALREVRPTLGCIGYGLATKWQDTNTGRTAIRRAMADARVPVPDEPILTGDDGEPVLPPGVAASIGQSRGVAVAVAAHAECFSSMGVDLELSGLPGDAVQPVLTTAEQAWLLDGYAGPERDRRLLSALCAKEAACKAMGREQVDGSLLRIHLIPFASSFIAWPRDRRTLRLRVWVRRIGAGVLTWTAIPTGERSRTCSGSGHKTSSRCANGPAPVAGQAVRR